MQTQLDTVTGRITSHYVHHGVLAQADVASDHGELIPHELDGTVDFELTADGARCKFEIPVRWLSSSVRQDDGTSDPKATSGAPGAADEV